MDALVFAMRDIGRRGGKEKVAGTFSSSELKGVQVLKRLSLSGTRGVRLQQIGTCAVKTKDSSPSLRWLLVNSLGNLPLLDYHPATGTSAGATASVGRERSGRPWGSEPFVVVLEGKLGRLLQRGRPGSKRGTAV